MSAALQSTATLSNASSATRDDALLELLGQLRERDYRFITVTPASHQRLNRRPGNQRAQDLRGVFGWSRSFAADLLPAPLFELLQQAEALQRCGDAWRSDLRVSSLDDQLLLHSAFPTDAADAVFFGPDSYRFVAAIQRHLAASQRPLHRALDIGCGAGPGAISIALARPDAQVLAVDINSNALRLARINAAFAGVDLQLMQSNLLQDVPGTFDLIVANPPYLLDPQQRTYRHGGGELGAGLSLDILDAALTRLNPGGTLLLYTGVAMLDEQDPFLAAARARLGGTGAIWSYCELDPDVFGEELNSAPYARAERIAAVLLSVTRAD
jgi:methylase of polypeptide subunit release factors